MFLFDGLVALVEFGGAFLAGLGFGLVGGVFVYEVGDLEFVFVEEAAVGAEDGAAFYGAFDGFTGGVGAFEFVDLELGVGGGGGAGVCADVQDGKAEAVEFAAGVFFGVGGDLAGDAAVVLVYGGVAELDHGGWGMMFGLIIQDGGFFG